MKGIRKAAKVVNGNSRMCAKCPSELCSPMRHKICSAAFVEGFVKGASYYKKHLWHPSSETPKKDAPLLLQLDNDTIVFGKFEGWGYTYSVSEEKLLDKVEVVRWLYLKDIL